MNRSILGAALTVALLMTARFALAQSPALTDGTPVTMNLSGVSMVFTPPTGWAVNPGDPPSYFDLNGAKGSIQFLFSPMPETMPFDVMHKANLDSATAKVQTGQYEKVEEKTLGGLTGVVTIEGTKDPSIRRLQWICCSKDKKGQFIFTMASEGAAFEGYKATFSKVLDSISFPQPK